MKKVYGWREVEEMKKEATKVVEVVKKSDPWWGETTREEVHYIWNGKRHIEVNRDGFPEWWEV